MSSPLEVLLVDDSAGDRELVVRMLPREYRVRQAASAAEAREAFADAQPDVVLLDYRLPDADGTELLPMFTERHVPVVMLTGMEVTEIVVEAMQGGAHDYLVKNNLSEADLGRILGNAIDKARLQRAVEEQQTKLAGQAAALEAKNREISALASALTLAEQAERRRLSNLLHDHLQQLLFGAKLSLGGVVEEGEVEARAKTIGEVEAILDEAIATTRDLAVELTPPVLDHEELEVALRWVASHMAERYGLEVLVEPCDKCRVPARELRVLLLQLVRELLFNVVKHAGTEHARISLDQQGGHYAISVSDEGAGFDPSGFIYNGDTGAETPVGRGFGLHSVRERLELLGGRLEIDSEPGRGSRITIYAPISVGTPQPPLLPDLFG